MEKGSIVGIIMVILGIFWGGDEGRQPRRAVQQSRRPSSSCSCRAIGATFMSFSANEMKNLGKYMKSLQARPPPDPGEVIGQIVEFADRARREGLLALEDDHQPGRGASSSSKGLQMAIDGADPEVVRDTLGHRGARP